jgi:PAS domain S-box-containing protein
MSLVATIDIISLLAVTASLAFLYRGWRRPLPRDIKWLILGLLSLTSFHHFSNILEWGEITKMLDPFEDFIELLVPILWIMLIHTYLKELTADDLRESEKALRKEKEFTGAVLDAQLDTFFLFEPKTGRAVRWNQAFRDISGYTDEEIAKNKAPDTYYSVEDLKRAFDFIQTVLKTGSGTIQLELICKDGRKIPTEYMVSLIKGRAGKSEYFISIGRDISERKRSEKGLRESEEKYRLLTESMKDVVVRLSPDKKLLYVSPAVKEFGGYNPAEEIGNHMSKYFERESDLIRAKEVFDNVLLRPESGTFEFLFKAENKRPFPIELTYHPIVKNNKVTVIQMVLRDISERKEAEEALRKSEEKLARMRKMESLGLLAGGVAHDLNNVLSGIVSYPDLLLIDLPENSKLRQPIETMQASGKMATAIVQDLLTVARGVATTKTSLNLNDIIDDYLNSPEFSTLKQFHPTVKIGTDFDRKLMNINGSRVHIRKVVMNLISNAAEAIEDSGHVTLSTRNRYLDRPIRGYDDVTIGEYAILSVSDDGMGITKEDLERIFEPFYTKKILGRRGTGLGLAVVWNVVQDHNGYIDIISDKKGTTFNLYLPISRDDLADQKMSIPVEDYQGNGETILVVDDVESQREISCKMLDTLGYQTISVASGEEAIEFLKTNTVDLILLDMIMDPGISGRKTYERIIKMHPKQKAVIVSGFAETQDVKETQKMGAGKYIKKPLTLETIGPAVKEELNK